MFKSGIKNRFKALFLAGIFLHCALFTFAQKHFSLTKKYAPAALQEDTRIIRDVILEMHPVMGIYKPKTYYENGFDQLIASLKDSLTEKEYRLRLKLLFDELHCGHTEVWQSKAYTKLIKPVKLNFLPYYMISLDKKVFVGTAINSKKDSVLKPGTEILRINNVGVDSILNYAKHFISGDGFTTTGKDLYLRTGFNYTYPSLFGRPDSFLIESKYKDKLQSNWIKAANLKDLPIKPLLPKEDTTYVKYRRANISSGYLDETKKTAVLKIKSFRSIKYKKVYRRFFRKLEKEQVDNLVIDLRYNGGGNLMNSYRLLSYLIDKPQTITLKTHVKNYPNKKYTRGNLGFKVTRMTLGVAGKKTVKGDTVFYTQKIKPSKKHHYNKNTYVLINGGTFSASCIISAYLQESHKAVFIGSETGGAKEGCNAGVTPYYTLPNTKIKIRVPAFRIVHDINPTITGNGIKPDHEINYTLQDLVSRKDLELKKVRELIKN